ncbi:MAG TPA: hypothetical protein VII72_02640 [Myxococcota bacterium]|jgi:hypothetical protein
MTTCTDAKILGYRHFLETRDGTLDAQGETLSAREAFFQRIEEKSVRAAWRPDAGVYQRNVARSRPEPGLDERMLWLVATAKANQSERFGVELGRLYGLAPTLDTHPEQLHVLLQETYHTRTLADVVAIFGLRVPLRPPQPATRRMIELMLFTPIPERFLLPLVGMSEQMGCVMFRLLRDRGVALFAGEPEVAERIRVLFDEILADEICHVGLIEARLGATGRAVMRALQRRIAPRIAPRLSPESTSLFGRDAFARAIRAPFDQAALAAEFPRTAYAFASP